VLGNAWIDLQFCFLIFKALHPQPIQFSMHLTPNPSPQGEGSDLWRKMEGWRHFSN
jgi:hypothetical protein